MTHKLKAIGLCLVAVLAMSAMVTSVASAQDKITSSVDKTILTGATETGTKSVFEAGGQIIECNATYYGTMAQKEVTEFTVHPEYTGCMGPGSHTVVTTHGCDYILTGTTDESDTGGIPGAKHATVKLECTAGSHIIAHLAGVCTLTFTTQSPKVGGAVYTNVTNDPVANSLHAITVNFTVTEIAFTKTNGDITGGNLCFLLQSPGVLTEKAIFTGYEDKMFQLDSVTHTRINVEEGARVPITVK